MTNSEEEWEAQVGTWVKLELLDERGENELMEAHIVSDDYADIAKGFLGAGTPLARALEGHKAGESIQYEMGDIRALRILEVRLSDVGPDQDIARRRQETMRKALDQSDRTNAILFASSFNGKWGDYDPSSLAKEDEEGDSPTPV